jgi:hypothetical protein
MAPFNALLSFVVFSATAHFSSAYFTHLERLKCNRTCHQYKNLKVRPHQESRNFVWKTAQRSNASTALRVKRPDRDDDLIGQIISPFERIIQLLATPIGPTLLPIIYPCSIVSFNIAINSMTSIIFDVIFALFYTLIYQIKRMESDTIGDDIDANVSSEPILDFICLFAAATGAIIISPNGFESNTIFDGNAPLIPLILSLGSLVSVTLFTQVNGNIRNGISQEVNPEKRLLEIFDEKLDNDDHTSAS